MNPHLQPWAIAADDFPKDSYTCDQLEFLLGYAILAPSNHNTQPWLFRINTADVELFADRRRALRVVDPYDRQLVLGCGAALYNLRVAAEYFSHQCRIELLPETADANLLARFHMGLAAETSSEDVLLFQAITQRHTNREPFRPEPVPAAVQAELCDAAAREGAWLQVVEEESARQAVAELVAAGDRAQWANRAFREELARWVRTDATHQQDGIPAHELGVSDWLAFAGPSLIRTFNRGNKCAAQDADIARHSPVLAVLGTDTESPRAWLAAGQALQSVLLHAQTEGLSASFLNQPIEVEEFRAQLADLAGRPGLPQCLIRLGYGPPVAATPRRSVRQCLIRHETPRVL